MPFEFNFNMYMRKKTEARSQVAPETRRDESSYLAPTRSHIVEVCPSAAGVSRQCVNAFAYRSLGGVASGQLVLAYRHPAQRVDEETSARLVIRLGMRCC